MNPDDVLDVYVPGRWRCPQCEFVLTQATMFVRSGEIGHTRDEVMRMSGESCPNDGTPMARVTWREEAEDNYRYATKLIDDVLALSGAKSLPEAMDQMKRDAEGPVRRYQRALESIAANSCCDRCQEASLVAKAALRSSPASTGQAEE